MIGSEAEQRIRAKAETLLRQVQPEGRIIHELEIGGVRLDLASISPERMILVEIKSERDKLDRLKNQIRWARRLGGEVWVCFAPKWREAIKLRCQSQDYTKPIRRDGYTCYADNPLYIRELHQCQLLEETDVGFSGYSHHASDPRHDSYNSHALLNLLHKAELLALARPFGVKSRDTCPDLIRTAHENLTGGQVRRGVMAALRARNFWKADTLETAHG
jgi:hypothetical protein